MNSLPTITLKQLHYFANLARSASFAAAAEAVHISQPAMSLQIKALEEAFGGQLIERKLKGINLTPLGDAVLTQATEILSQVETLTTLRLNADKRPSAPVRLGLIPTVAPYLLPRAFPALQQKLPEIRIAIREGRTRQLLQDLLNNQLDAAIIALPTDQKGLSSSSLFNEPFLVAAGMDFQTKTDGKLSAGDLSGHDILLLEEGHCLRDQAIQACGINVNHALNQFGATSLATIVEMVAHGFGVTLLPKMAVEKEASDPRIKLFEMKSPEPGRELGLVWRNSSPYSDLYEEMSEVIKSASE